MSVSPVSSSSITYAPAVMPSVPQGIADFGVALMSGDLAGAQSAYKTLAQVATPDPNSPYAPGIKSLTEALRAGDLEGAQDALTALQDQVKASRSASAQPYDASGSAAAASASSALIDVSA